MSVQLNSILISDAVDGKCEALLTSHGVSVTTKYKLSKEELIMELQKHDGLIVRSETKVVADVLAGAPNLKIIGRAGTGVDNIDIAAATENGVLVLNTPGGNSISACELTCAMISALARNIVQAGQSMKEGRWDRKIYAGTELSEKVLGVLGYGRIGREVAHRMKSYGMRIIAYDPVLTAEQITEPGVTKGTLEDVWRDADYVTVHTPLLPSTRSLINATSLSLCKKGVYIINVARGGIVDEEALLASIKLGHCAGAALDVFTDEPPKSAISLELIKHPNVIATPHLGASTEEAQTRVAVEIAEQFLAISGRSSAFTVSGIVNAPIMAAAVHGNNELWINLARRLGKIAGKLVSNKLKDITIESLTTGVNMSNKKFVHTALFGGLLASGNKKGINLVNAPNLAKQLGIQLREAHDNSGSDGLTIKAGGHIIKGSVVGNATVLLSIDDAIFSNGVQLQENISIYRVKTSQDLAHIISAHAANDVIVHNINIAKNWIIVQTDRPVSVVVEAVEGY